MTPSRSPYSGLMTTIPFSGGMGVSAKSHTSNRMMWWTPAVSAFFLNCSIKPSSEISNTQALMDKLAGASYIEAGGDLSPYVNRNVQLAAQNLVFGAKLMGDNPYPTNLRVIKEKMMAGMQVKMAAMKKMTAELRKQMTT